MKKIYRIRKNQEFSAIIQQHHSLANSSFVLYAQRRSTDNARIGLSVSHRLGNAVVRNKIKRQIRMMVLELLPFAEYPYDAVVIVRKPYLRKTYEENKKDLLKLFRTVKIN